MVRGNAPIVALLGLLGGCVALTPLQESGLSEIREMVDATSRAYGLGRIRVLVDDQYAGLGSTYRPGLLTVAPDFLTSPSRDARTAVMLGYAMAPNINRRVPMSSSDRQARQLQRALAAYAKGVEILQRVSGRPEEDALREVYMVVLAEHGMDVAAGIPGSRANLTRGCEAIADLLRRFPPYGWTGGAQCGFREGRWTVPETLSKARAPVPDSPEPVGRELPLDSPDPRYADYFRELKNRIEANWAYPPEAARRNQSGSGVVAFVLRKDGSVREVGVLDSTGFALLDLYVENAIKFAAPFPPIPENVAGDELRLRLDFHYICVGDCLGGRAP